MEHEGADPVAKDMQQWREATAEGKQAPEEWKSWLDPSAGRWHHGPQPFGRGTRSLSLLGPELHNLQVQLSAERGNVVKIGAWSDPGDIQTARYGWSDFKDGEWFQVLPTSEDFLGGCLVQGPKSCFKEIILGILVG